MGTKKLEWDSSFFGLNVAEYSGGRLAKEDWSAYDLVVAKTNESFTPPSNFIENYSEVKVIFRKEKDNFNKIYQEEILDWDNIQLKPKDFYNLAYQSGHKSRFFLDNNFPDDSFYKMYKLWVDNSFNKSFAEKIFYAKKENSPIGFISYRNLDKIGLVGLFAVDKSSRGMGLGRKILLQLEAYCSKIKNSELQIPTQLENKSACKFYESNGYKIHSKTKITHFWKK